MNQLGEQDFRLGGWLVAPKLNCLSRDGKTTRLEPKVMQVLVCLAEAGDVVPKEKLMARVWAGTFVTDDVLTRCISELRKAFEDDARNPRYIQTIPKGGYRLLVRAEAANGHGVVTSNAIEEECGSGRVNGTAPNRVPHLHAEIPTADLRTIRARWVAAVALVLAVALLGALALRRTPSSPPSPSSTSAASPAASISPGRVMLAVLPFQNLSNEGSQDYFADGLTAEMISQLGRLPSDRVGVIAWNSMMRYRGAKKTEAEVGAELGANYVLEGTVRREAQHVRITAELVKIGDPSHIWANSYDGDLSDVLALQTHVAREIAQEIQLRLTPEQEVRLGHPDRVNGDGYDAYLKGKAVFELGSKAARKNDAEDVKKAVDLSPGYAPVYILLAAYYRDQASHGIVPSKDAYASARSALAKALQIDPNSAPARREMAWVDWRGEWDFPDADREYRLSIELSPNDAGTHEQYSLYLKSQRRYDDAFREINRCLELNPLGAYAHANAGTLLGLMGRYDESMEHFRKSIEIAPDEAYVHERKGAVLLWQAKTAGKRERVIQVQAIDEFQKAVTLSDRRPEDLAWLGYAFAARGKENSALKVLEQMKLNPSKKYVSPFYMAMLYAGLDDREEAFSWLDKAYAEHDEWMVYLNIYPEFDALHSDPRFEAIVRRLRLP